MFVTGLGTGFTALVSDAGNALIAASSVISGSCHKVVAEVGKMHKLFCRNAEDSHQRFNKSSETGDGRVHKGEAPDAVSYSFCF